MKLYTFSCLLIGALIHEILLSIFIWNWRDFGLSLIFLCIMMIVADKALNNIKRRGYRDYS